MNLCFQYVCLFSACNFRVISFILIHLSLLFFLLLPYACTWIYTHAEATRLHIHNALVYLKAHISLFLINSESMSEDAHRAAISSAAAAGPTSPPPKKAAAAAKPAAQVRFSLITHHRLKGVGGGYTLGGPTSPRPKRAAAAKPPAVAAHTPTKIDTCTLFMDI